MNKNELTARVRAALEDWEYPCEEIESQPGLQWFQPLSDDYENDYALGELFFASDLTDEDMNGLEIVQCNLVFQRELPAGAADALRALLAPVNRQISGGRFDVQAEESCFVEYGHDLVLPADLDDDRAAAVVLGALDLANAYIHIGLQGGCRRGKRRQHAGGRPGAAPQRRIGRRKKEPPASRKQWDADGSLPCGGRLGFQAKGRRPSHGRLGEKLHDERLDLRKKVVAVVLVDLHRNGFVQIEAEDAQNGLRIDDMATRTKINVVGVLADDVHEILHVFRQGQVDGNRSHRKPSFQLLFQYSTKNPRFKGFSKKFQKSLFWVLHFVRKCV